MEDKVIQYLLSLGFEISPCYVPLNAKESFKKDLYDTIRKISQRLFIFVNRIYPIKFASTRDDKSIWFILRNVCKATIFEIELKPAVTWGYTLSTPYNFDYTKWLFRIYTKLETLYGTPFVFIDGVDFFYLYPNQEESECGVIDEIEYHLTQIPLLKQLIRDKKLKSILDGE